MLGLSLRMWKKLEYPPWESNGLEMPLQGNSFYDLTITLGSRSHKMKLSTYICYLYSYKV